MDAREVLRKIAVEETIEYTVETKDNEEGVGLRISFIDHGQSKEIFLIDGLTRDALSNVRFGILRLLHFLDSKIKEGATHE